MAFVRWRGNCAQLLATRYEAGRSRQILLANLQSGYSVQRGMQKSVTNRFPDIPVDWAAVDRALAQGPPGSPPLTEEQWTYVEVERALRQWATTLPLFKQDAEILRSAAQVLASRRAQETQSILP